MERPLMGNLLRILKGHYPVAAVALWSLQAIVTIAQAVDVLEYYNASHDHYFTSSLQPDINALDSGHFPGWARTGLTFKAMIRQNAANATDGKLIDINYELDGPAGYAYSWRIA